MLKLLKTLFATFVCLFVIDGMVAVALSALADRPGPTVALVRYFDYGRSVPGKLREWAGDHDLPGNLFDVAWRTDILRDSTERFSSENPQTSYVRAYGMSFVDNIIKAAKAKEPNLQVDLHSGPGAPPNFTYALFLDDRQNRRPGDIAVFGILSSSVTGMAALSNRTWVFEQPAPFTYPVFLPATNDKLIRIEPLLESATVQRTFLQNPDSTAARAWQRQLGEIDAFYSPEGFALPWLDTSPFARLVRRSLAIKSIKSEKEQLLNDPEGGNLPYGAILRRMVRQFAQIAREDGQLPVVVLVQLRGKPDLRDILFDTLMDDDIPYLATADIQDPNDPGAYVGDGHFKGPVNERFGVALLKLIHGR